MMQPQSLDLSELHEKITSLEHKMALANNFHSRTEQSVEDLSSNLTDISRQLAALSQSFEVFKTSSQKSIKDQADEIATFTQVKVANIE